MDGQPNGWAALMAFFSMISAIGVIVGPILANRKAREVKADLAVAKEAVDRQDTKLTEVHTIVNGKSEAKDRHIAELEAYLEDRERSG
jgi:hypothetical protein